MTVRPPKTLPVCPITYDEIYDQLKKIKNTYGFTTLCGSPTFFELYDHYMKQKYNLDDSMQRDFEHDMDVLFDMLEDWRHYNAKYFKLLR